MAFLALASPRSTPAVRGYIRPRCALRLRTCRGGGRGTELPILVRSPQPAVLAVAPASPQRETGSEKRKKIARRKLPNIGPLLHHHQQPLSKATRAHSLSLSLPPSSSHLLNSPSRRPSCLPGPLEQCNSCNAPKDNSSRSSRQSVWCDLLIAAPDIHLCSIPESYFFRNHNNSPACSAQYCEGKSFNRETPSDKLCPPLPAWQDGTPPTRLTPSSRCPHSRQP